MIKRLLISNNVSIILDIIYIILVIYVKQTNKQKRLKWLFFAEIFCFAFPVEILFLVLDFLWICLFFSHSIPSTFIYDITIESILC